MRQKCLNTRNTNKGREAVFKSYVGRVVNCFLKRSLNDHFSIFHFLDNFLFLFLLYNWNLQKIFQFLQICYFFADSKSRAQVLSNDVTFVIFGHQTYKIQKI